MRKATIVALFMSMFAFTTPVFAQTPDYGAQITALLAQVQALQVQIAQLEGRPGSMPSVPGVPGNPEMASCVDLSRNLSVGETDARTGGEVSKLQRFLGGSVTGYFGPLTLGLVQEWQASRGIVSSGSAAATGYGSVGPRTRAAMKCTYGMPPSGHVPAPVTPPYPLPPDLPPLPTPPTSY
jgi:peptidoglycan hydrolase-like protein with peptidoglycan-binding domain